MVKTWCDIICCMRWSCFVTELSATGRSHMVVALLYEMQSPCNSFTLSLSGSDSRKSNKLARRQRCYDGDQGVAPVTMVIMTVLRRWRSRARCFGDGDHKHKMMMAISYHLYWLHVMLILYASYLALFDGSIIRWSFTKLSKYKCSPWVCTIAKVLRAETPRDDRVW